MNTLEDVVRKIVDDFVAAGTLFTALDVSNEVKKTRPFDRHREIRDTVRSLYTEMQNSGYGRTPIEVTLADGSKQDALLYHPLSDSWDLDTKYDAQRRTAQAATPAASISLQVTMPTVAAAPVAQPVPQPPVVQAVPAQPTDPKQLWDNLFGAAKLFPTI